jgi:uncharacterized small protein (DUF1192 family)
MALFDEDGPRRKVTHEIGQDLAQLSVMEIDARIALLRQEIDRLEAMRASKQASRAAADAVFGRKVDGQ